MAAAVRAGLGEAADPGYVEGIVRARRPGKTVLGVRIPLLRAAVRTAARAARADPATIVAAADLLWRGVHHEDELAGCMLLRVTGTPVTATLVAGWAALLDNWLSVDELGGCLGDVLTTDPDGFADVAFLLGGSVWARRLYVVAAIRPIRAGLQPAAVPDLVTVMQQPDPPIRKAAAWLLRDVLAKRPAAVEEFLSIWPADAAGPLTRTLHQAQDR